MHPRYLALLVATAFASMPIATIFAIEPIAVCLPAVLGIRVGETTNLISTFCIAYKVRQANDKGPLTVRIHAVLDDCSRCPQARDGTGVTSLAHLGLVIGDAAHMLPDLRRPCCIQ